MAMLLAPLLASVLALALGLVPALGQTPPKPTIGAAAGTLRVETVASGLSYPWSLVFLPD
jgi:glucose/arabinose dehydrogenase